MIKNDIIYNIDYLVIVPYYHEKMLKAFEHSFKYVYLFDNKKEVKDHINIIKKSNIKQLIFVDYLIEYNDLIKYFEKTNTIKFIYTKYLGAFSNNFNYQVFSEIMSLYNKKKIKEIGFIDSNLYYSYNKKIDCKQILIDIPIEEKYTEFKSNTIGVLNAPDNPRHSYYNSLSALKFKNYKASITNLNDITKNFLELFDIDYEDDKNINNILNLYINFTDNDNLVFINSMDKGVPCILGNNDLLEDSKLKDYLVVKSDDSIDEISEKIEDVLKNKEKIMKLYKEFRANYSKKCVKQIAEFLEIEEKSLIETEKEKDSDLLLTIVVPVYNTEKYIAKCLDSIIKAIPQKILNDTEILIVNDGSTDNSEEVIKTYEKQYDKLIRYIKQENHGLGNVRNVGLKESKGKYIASIDSDDTINSDFFTSCLDDLLNDVDIAICDWLTITNTEKYETAAIEWIFKDNNQYEGLMISSIMPSTCNKIFKKSLFEELKLKYLEDKYEDLSTNPIILMKANTIKYVTKAYYEYYIRSNSLMRTSAGLSMINVLQELDKRIEDNKKYLKIDINKFKFYTFSWRIEEYIINQVYQMDEKEIPNYLKYIYDNIYEIMISIFEDKNYENMLNDTKEKTKKYILERNKSIKAKEFESFLKNRKQTIKLTPSIVYFGEQ